MGLYSFLVLGSDAGSVGCRFHWHNPSCHNLSPRWDVPHSNRVGLCVLALHCVWGALSDGPDRMQKTAVTHQPWYWLTESLVTPHQSITVLCGDGLVLYLNVAEFSWLLPSQTDLKQSESLICAPAPVLQPPCRHVKDIHMTLIIMHKGDGAFCVIISNGGHRGLTLC